MSSVDLQRSTSSATESICNVTQIPSVRFYMPGALEYSTENDMIVAAKKSILQQNCSDLLRQCELGHNFRVILLFHIIIPISELYLPHCEQLLHEKPTSQLHEASCTRLSLNYTQLCQT